MILLTTAVGDRFIPVIASGWGVAGGAIRQIPLRQANWAEEFDGGQW